MLLGTNILHGISLFSPGTQNMLDLGPIWFSFLFEIFLVALTFMFFRPSKLFLLFDQNFISFENLKNFK